MYIWDIKSLKEDLREGSLTESESFKYIFAIIFCDSLSAISNGNNKSYQLYPGQTFLLGLIGLVILSGGMCYCYKKNGGSKGQHFIQRFLSLKWVVGWRIFAMAFLPAIIVLAILMATKVLPLSILLMGITFLIIAIIYYWLIGEHLGDLASATIVTPEVTTPDDFTMS